MSDQSQREPADRPIQAGDWVECVNAQDADELVIGGRYLVNTAREPRGAIVETYITLSVFGCSRRASRFKRVDGPHPALMAGRCSECGNLPDDGRSLTCSCSYHAVEATQLAPKCSECTAPATHDHWCVYCAHATEDGNGERDHIEVVVAYQMRIGQMSDGSRIPGELKARKRVAAWDRAERPRGNPKDRIELAKPHPWEMNDD